MADRIDLLPPDAGDDLRLRLALHSLAGAAPPGDPAPSARLRGIGTRRRRVRVAFTSAAAVAATVLAIGAAGRLPLPFQRDPVPAARSGALLVADELPVAGGMNSWRVANLPADNALQPCLPTDVGTVRWFASGVGAGRAQTAVQNVFGYPDRQSAVSGFGDAVARQRLCQTKVASTRSLSFGDAAAVTFGVVNTPDLRPITQGWVTVLRGRTVTTVGFSSAVAGSLPNAEAIPDLAARLAARLPAATTGRAADVVLSGLPDGAGPLTVPYGQQFGGSVDPGYLVDFATRPDGGLRLVLDRTLHLDERQYHRWAAANGAAESDRELGADRWEVNRNTVTRTFALAPDARIYLGGRPEALTVAELTERLVADRDQGGLKLPVLLLHAEGGTDGDVVLFQEEIR